MKTVTVLRIKSSLWFACLFLIIAPLPLLGTILAVFIVSWGDTAEMLPWMKTCFWTMVGICPVGFLVAWIGNSEVRTGNPVKDEKALRDQVAAFREIARMFTFGLVG